MNARDKKLNQALQYINGDNFSPPVFSETFKISEFNDDEKEKIAGALFLKIKSNETIIFDSTILLLSGHHLVEKKSHWYSYFSDKQKLKKYDKTAAAIINNQCSTHYATLELAIDYGSEEARAYKLQLNISNNNNNSGSASVTMKK